jgi:hypothetical protein
MASRAAKRVAAAEQEAATTERRTQTPANKQEDLKTENSRWGTEGARLRQKWQKGGKALATGRDPQLWRTDQQASRWWIRCEDCEGRIDSGKVAIQEDGTMMLLGWKPPTWPEPEAENTKGVITEVGKVCMIYHTGPGRIKKKVDDSHKQESEDESSKIPSKATPPTETGKDDTVKGVVLNDKQIEILEENLTVKQWRELAIKGRVVTAEQMNTLEDTLSTAMWRQLWA